MKRETLARALFKMADGQEMDADGRRACENAAKALTATISTRTKLQAVFVPFSGVTIATCGICREPLQTESKTCNRCGALIDWRT